MSITADATAAAVSVSAGWNGAVSASIAAAIAENTFSGATRAGIDNALVEQFLVEVRGENGEVKAEFDNGSPELLELHTEAPVKATFPLQYLEDMVKATSGNSLVKINLETDRPLKLEYEIEGAKIVYYLAPRIETE